MRAVQVILKTSSELPVWLDKLGDSLAGWFSKQGHVNDLNRAITVREKAIQSTQEKIRIWKED